MSVRDKDVRISMMSSMGYGESTDLRTRSVSLADRTDSKLGVQRCKLNQVINSGNTSVNLGRGRREGGSLDFNPLRAYMSAIYNRADRHLFCRLRRAIHWRKIYSRNKPCAHHLDTNWSSRAAVLENEPEYDLRTWHCLLMTLTTLNSPSVVNVRRKKSFTFAEKHVHSRRHANQWAYCIHLFFPLCR